jgi:hypothetical protein
LADLQGKIRRPIGWLQKHPFTDRARIPVEAGAEPDNTEASRHSLKRPRLHIPATYGLNTRAPLFRRQGAEPNVGSDYFWPDCSRQSRPARDRG